MKLPQNFFMQPLLKLITIQILAAALPLTASLATADGYGVPRYAFQPQPVPPSYPNPYNPYPPNPGPGPGYHPLPPPQGGHPGPAPQPYPGTGFHPIPGGPGPVPRTGVPPHMVGRPVFVAPPHSDLNDQQAAVFFQTNFGQTRCEQLGDSLRRLSNQILTNSIEVSTPPPSVQPVPGGSLRERLRQENRAKMLARFRDPQFWTRIWTRLADVYRSCEMQCFDDGQAVGEISASMYCSASISLNGLPSAQTLEQPALPLCQNSIFIGCQQGYRSTAAQTPGCSTYTGGQFESVFNESISLDCHIDQ